MKSNYSHQILFFISFSNSDDFPEKEKVQNVEKKSEDVKVTPRAFITQNTILIIQLVFMFYVTSQKWSPRRIICTDGGKINSEYTIFVSFKGKQHVGSEPRAHCSFAICPDFWAVVGTTDCASTFFYGHKDIRSRERRLTSIWKGLEVGRC